MTRGDFYLSTWRELYNRISGFTELENDRQLAAMARTRLLACYTFAPYSKKKLNKPSDLFKLPNEEGFSEITDEELAEMREMWDAYDKRVKAKKTKTDGEV